MKVPDKLTKVPKEHINIATNIPDKVDKCIDITTYLQMR